jgi:hypothetical protein
MKAKFGDLIIDFVLFWGLSAKIIISLKVS